MDIAWKQAVQDGDLAAMRVLLEALSHDVVVLVNLLDMPFQDVGVAKPLNIRKAALSGKRNPPSFAAIDANARADQDLILAQTTRWSITQK